MHELVVFNSELVRANDARLPAVSAGTFYGRGIFTTLPIFDSEPFLWEKHWRRLYGHSLKLNFDLTGFDARATRRSLDELVSANHVKNGRARVTFFDGSATEPWAFGSEHHTSLLITTDDLRPMPETMTLGLSPYRINSASPLAGVKSCNYLEKIIAKDEARQRGFGEAVQLNERGEITSACMANIFWRKGESLFTPSLATGCLAGTTREFVLENLECEQVDEGIDELRDADQIFLTSSGLGGIEVDELEGRRLQRMPHPLLELLRRQGR